MSNKQLERIMHIKTAAKKIIRRDPIDQFEEGYRLAFIPLLDELEEKETYLSDLAKWEYEKG